MTHEISVTPAIVFDSRTKHALYKGVYLAHKPIVANQKHRVLSHWCSRLTDSGLPGSSVVVEYLHGKYIKNLSVSTIKQAGRIVLYFLHFLARDGTTIYTLNRQNISAYVEYEQDRGLKPASIVNHLRALYAFIVFLVDQGTLPQAIQKWLSSFEQYFMFLKWILCLS